MKKPLVADIVLVMMASAVYVALLVLAASAGIALGYPESVRNTYTSCGSCHLSPAGGGAVNAYGRMVGEEWATWAPENSGQLFAGLVPVPERVAVGGDMRAIQIDTPYFRRQFLMQNDYELGLKLSNEVWVDAAYGRYFGHDKPESRRHFILWQPYELVSVRAGRFMPAYGLMLPDHTAATRGPLGFGEDRESFNAEISLHGAAGELFLTATAGDGSSLTLGDDPQYREHAEQPTYFGRASLFFLKSVVAGGSARATMSRRADGGTQVDYTSGPFLMWGITRSAYFLGEADRRFTDGNPHVDVGYAELGYEVFRGVHLQATGEFELTSRYGAALQWFPTPHLELLARSKYQDGVWGSQYLLHLNW